MATSKRPRTEDIEDIIGVPDDGEICIDNKTKMHVGDDIDIDDIEKYIKENIIWYMSNLDEKYNINTLFNQNDEGLLKYIKLILIEDAKTIQKQEIYILLKSILDAIQVDQEHDFLDGSFRSKSSKSNNDDLRKCLGYPRDITLHEKMTQYLKVFDSSSDVKNIVSGDDISDIEYSIRDTGVREDFSKKIVSNTKQVVAIASIIDSAGCSQTNRNMPEGIDDKLEIIITNIGYIFYQSFYKWFRINKIVTLIKIEDTISKFINGCDKKYCIEFYTIDEKNEYGISSTTKIYKKFHTEKTVIPGCNGDFTVNKIVNILYKAPIKCCEKLYKKIYDTFKKSDEKTKQIVMTYYVLNKGFGDFSQMFSCLYFNNRETYGIYKNIHHKNIILCTVDRFLAYISHLCKCPFILGASYTCRYYSCNTNSKYYRLNIIESYNKFNNLKLTQDINDTSILIQSKSNIPILTGDDYKSKLINSKQSIISRYYETNLICIYYQETDVKLSSYKIPKKGQDVITENVLSYSLKLNQKISKEDLNVEINEENFTKYKEIYDKLVNNDCKSIAESEIFSDFILENYIINGSNMFNKIAKIIASYNRQFPALNQSSSRSTRNRNSKGHPDNLDFEKYEKNKKNLSSILDKGLSSILVSYVESKDEKLKILGFFISYFEDIQNNTKLLENHLKKIYIIINESKELDEETFLYIKVIISNLKKCLHFFINEIKRLNINILEGNVSSIIEIYTANPYYTEGEGFESKLSLETANMTEQYNLFILQYDTFKNIKTRFEKLKFEYAFHNAKIAYNIAFGKLRLIKPSQDEPSSNVRSVSSNIMLVTNFISILKEKTEKIRENIREKKNDDKMETDDFIQDQEQDKDKDKDLDLDLVLDYTEEEINLINENFINSIDETEKEEAIQEEDEFIKKTGIFEYNCDDICEGPNRCFLSNDKKESFTGGNINENKILNRYIQRIILIKYNINKLIKSKNHDKNIKKMYKQINDIKIKIHNIKEKDKINKKNKLKAVKEDKIIKQKAVKEAKIIKQKAVKDAKIIKQKHVKDTKDKKPKHVKEIKVKQPKPVKDTKNKKPKPVKEIKVKQPKPVKETKDKKPKHVKETNVKQSKNLKEIKSKSPKPEKESKSKSPKPEKEIKSKSPKPEKDSKSKSPKTEKDSKSKSLKPEKDSKSKSLKPEKESKSKSHKPEKESKSKSPKPEKDSKSKSPKLKII